MSENNVLDDIHAQIHRNLHEQMHKSFDCLLADFLRHNPERTPSNTTVTELMFWSHRQTIAADPLSGHALEAVREQILARSATRGNEPIRRVRTIREIIYQGPASWVQGCLDRMVKVKMKVGAGQFVIGQDPGVIEEEPEEVIGAIACRAVEAID